MQEKKTFHSQLLSIKREWRRGRGTYPHQPACQDITVGLHTIHTKQRNGAACLACITRDVGWSKQKTTSKRMCCCQLSTTPAWHQPGTSSRAGQVDGVWATSPHAFLAACLHLSKKTSRPLNQPCPGAGACGCEASRPSAARWAHCKQAAALAPATRHRSHSTATPPVPEHAEKHGPLQGAQHRPTTLPQTSCHKHKSSIPCPLAPRPLAPPRTSSCARLFCMRCAMQTAGSSACRTHR